MKDQFFLSCDWGTSFFRINLVRTVDLTVIAGKSSSQGIADTYKQWSSDAGRNRAAYYLSIIKQEIQSLQIESGIVLKGIPVVLSGMASSSIGIIELAYSTLPTNIDCSKVNVQVFDATRDLDHPLLLVSGLRTANEVMRGEETQLAGCNVLISPIAGLYILPGTHSKHVWVHDKMITEFETYMTGEMFEVLSASSVLASSIDASAHHTLLNEEAFKSGLRKGAEGNLLNTIFQVRTNAIFKRFSNLENYYFLSGILIGYEISAIRYSNLTEIVLIGKESLTELYTQALKYFNYPGRITSIDGSQALLAGQKLILRQHLPGMVSH